MYITASIKTVKTPSESEGVCHIRYHNNVLHHLSVPMLSSQQVQPESSHTRWELAFTLPNSQKDFQHSQRFRSKIKALLQRWTDPTQKTHCRVPGSWIFKAYKWCAYPDSLQFDFNATFPIYKWFYFLKFEGTLCSEWLCFLGSLLALAVTSSAQRWSVGHEGCAPLSCFFLDCCGE